MMFYIIDNMIFYIKKIYNYFFYDCFFEYIENLWISIYNQQDYNSNYLFGYNLSHLDLIYLIKKKIYFNYSGSDVPISKIKITNSIKFINEINKFFNSDNSSRTYILNKKYNFIVKKLKNSKSNNPDNYRYIIQYSNLIRIIDKIYFNNLKQLLNNKINTDIIKYSFNNKMISNNIFEIANKNALECDNSILLDIKSAYDSVEYHILSKILNNSLKKKNIENAKEIIDFYLHILLNSKVSYNNKTFNKTKGIPMGLSSSNLIFVLFMEEIIDNWININNFKNKLDFEIIVYVDDIYIKIIDINKTNSIIKTLINELEKNLLYLNLNKCKYGINLDLTLYNFRLLNYKENIDEYLGLPIKITDHKLYMKWFINNYKIKHNRNYINDFQLIKLENTKKYSSLKLKVLGFSRYKIIRILNTHKYNDEYIINFIDSQLKNHFNI